MRGPIQIAVACDSADSELLAAARALAPGGAIVVGGAVDSSELLLGRDRIGGRDAAYVCRGRVCDLPVTTAEELAAALGALRVACGTCRAPSRSPQTVNRYLELRRARAAVDDIAELYADDATVEDPVGGEVHIGRQAIRGFYSGVPRAAQVETEIVTLRALGHEAAFFWRLTIDLGEGGHAHRDHQRHDVRRRREDHVDEGLLGSGRTSPSSSDSRVAG